MRSGIAVVALPRLGEKSLSRARDLSTQAFLTLKRRRWLRDLDVLRPGDHE
jgi:hypothetical protein